MYLFRLILTIAFVFTVSVLISSPWEKKEKTDLTYSIKIK
jgi:hypothetical protein